MEGSWNQNYEYALYIRNTPGYDPDQRAKLKLKSVCFESGNPKLQ